MRADDESLRCAEMCNLTVEKAYPLGYQYSKVQYS